MFAELCVVDMGPRLSFRNWEAHWPSGLERWTGDRVVLVSNPGAATSLLNFGNSVYPAVPVCFGGDTKSRRSLLSGVYARGSKRSHQSALEKCNLSLSPHSSLVKDNSLNHSCVSPKMQRWAVWSIHLLRTKRTN